MAAAKTKKRSIIIGNKEYTMPQKMSTMAYLRYLEVRDSIMDTEAKQALYTRQQFMDMMDVMLKCTETSSQQMTCWILKPE